MNSFKGPIYQRGYGLKGPTFQRGFGVGTFFRGSYYQNGYGIGGLFRRFLNWMKPYAMKALPILKDGFKSIGKHVVNSTSNLANDMLDGKNVSFKETLDNEVPLITEKIKDLGKNVVENTFNGKGKKNKKKSIIKGNVKMRKLTDIFN